MISRIFSWFCGNPACECVKVELHAAERREQELKVRLDQKTSECECKERVLMEYADSKIRQTETIRKLGEELDVCQEQVERGKIRIEYLQSKLARTLYEEGSD